LFNSACGKQAIEMEEYAAETLAYEPPSFVEVGDNIKNTLHTIVETDEGMQRILPPGSLSI